MIDDKSKIYDMFNKPADKFGIHQIWSRPIDDMSEDMAIGVTSMDWQYIPKNVKEPKIQTDVDLTESINIEGQNKQKTLINKVIDDMRDNLSTKLDASSGDKTTGNPTFADYEKWMSGSDTALKKRAIDFRSGIKNGDSPGMELGDRLMWEQVLADKLMQRTGDYQSGNPLKDHQEAYARYMKILKLNDKYANAKSDNILTDSKGNNYLKVILDEKNKPTENEVGLGGAAFWGGQDYIAFTEYRPELKALVWKAMPPSAVAKAYLGIAKVMLDDVGKGRDNNTENTELYTMYGSNADVKAVMTSNPKMSFKDAVLTVAISYAQKANDLLTNTTDPVEAKERDFYSIGQTIITEAKLRSLRRGGTYQLTDEQEKTVTDSLEKTGKCDDIYKDSNAYVKFLLNKLLKTDLDTPVTILGETHAVKVWIGGEPGGYAGNKKILKYGGLSTPGTEPKDILPLSYIGIKYLRATAQLELAKLEMEADDDKYDIAVADVSNAILSTDAVLKTLIGAGGDINSLSQGLSTWGKLYADKQADYLTMDALKTKADLMKLLGNIVGNDPVTLGSESIDGDVLLGRANNLYKFLDDQNNTDKNFIFELSKDPNAKVLPDISPYQDIRDHSAVGRLSLSRQLENWSRNVANKAVIRYLAPETPDKDREYLTAPVYQGTYEYYDTIFNEGVILLQRNGTLGKFDIDPAKKMDKYGNKTTVLDLLPGAVPADDDPNKTVIPDSTMARSYFWEIIKNVESVKAVNTKGLKDLKLRAMLGAAEADSRLLNTLTDDDAKLKAVNTILASFQGIIIQLAGKNPASYTTLEDGAVVVEQEYGNLMLNDKRKYNKMDYPFYIELFNEMASLYEQKAWLETKDDRLKLKDTDMQAGKETPLYLGIKKKFDIAKSYYDKVWGLKKDKSGNVVNNEQTGLPVQTGLCKLPQVKSNYDLYVRPVNLMLQNISLDTYRINIDMKCGSETEANTTILKQIDDALTVADNVKIGDYTIAQLKALADKSTAVDEGVEKVTIKIKVNGRDTDIKLVKEAVLNLYAKLCDVKTQLISKKIFFTSKQTQDVYNVDKKQALITRYYTDAKALADSAIDKLVDPYYTISSMVGASMVYMVYSKQEAVDNIYAYYQKLGESSTLTYEMCEAFSIAAAVNKDMRMARRIINSLDTVINNCSSKISDPTIKADTVLMSNYGDILSQAAMWKGNLLSWFFNEMSETGNVSDLKDAKASFDISRTQNPDNLASKVNWQLAQYRIVNNTYKMSTRSDLTGANDAANMTVLVNNYTDCVSQFKSLADKNVNVNKVRNMSDNEVTTREEEYYAAKTKSIRALKTLAFNVLDLMQQDKWRINNYKDMVPTTKGKYVEQRVSLGDTVNKAKLDKINLARQKQKDESGNLVNWPNGDATIGATSVKGATMTPDQASKIFDASTLKWLGLSITSIQNEADMYLVIDALLGKENESLNTIKDRQGKYHMDLTQLATFSVSDVEVYGQYYLDHGTEYVNNPTGDETAGNYKRYLDASNKYAADMQKANAKVEPLVTIQGVVNKATVDGWIAMLSEDTAGLTRSMGSYGTAIAGYSKYFQDNKMKDAKVDIQLFNNQAEVMKINYFSTRSDTDFNNIINLYDMISANNKATIGGIAGINSGTLKLGRASRFEDNDKKRAVYIEVFDKSLEAMTDLTGKQFELQKKDSLTNDDRSKLTTLFIKYIKDDYNRGDQGKLSKDKYIIEALTNLVLAEAWLYTVNPDDQIGNIVDNLTSAVAKDYGFDVKRTGPFSIGEKYLDLRKKLWDVYTMALALGLKQDKAPDDINMSTVAKYDDMLKDKDIRGIVHSQSRNGLLWAIHSVQYAYGISEKERSALDKAGKSSIFFENEFVTK